MDKPTYQPRFFTPIVHDTRQGATPLDGSPAKARPVYVFTDRILIAVDVALATRRPLLIAGPPGSGKSTLARNVAVALKWRYLKQVVTSRTQVDDLLAGFDALRRLHDAQTCRSDEKLPLDWAYLEPGVFWWAFDPQSAACRGATDEEFQTLDENQRERIPPLKPPAEPGKQPDVVVLLDEIDKADPDVPNDLLEPLDLGCFTVHGREVKAQHCILMMITTNGERELPPAFLRRCVVLTLEDRGKDELIEIARHHYGDVHENLYHAVGQELISARDRYREKGLRPPSNS